MLLRFFIILFCSLSTVVLITAKEVSGYTIDTNGDTVTTLLHIPTYKLTGDFNSFRFQENPKQIVAGKKERIALKGLQEIGFSFEGEQYIFRVLVYKIGGIPERVLRRFISEGKVQVFKEDYTTMQNNGMIESRYFLVKGKEVHFPKPIGFHKKLKKFLRGCAEFDALLNQRKYKYKELRSLVEKYNTLCTSN